MNSYYLRFTASLTAIIVLTLPINTALSDEAGPQFMPARVRALAWAPDGARIAAVGVDRLVVYDAANAKEIRKVAVKTSRAAKAARVPAAVKYVAGGRLIATAGLGDIVTLWDEATLDKRLDLADSSGVTALAVTRDGSQLITAGYDAPVQIWDVATGAKVETLSPAPSGVISLALSQDGALLATGEAKHAVSVWSLQARNVVARADDYSGPVLSVAFSPDSRLLASNASGYEIRIWEVAGETQERRLITPEQATEGRAGLNALLLAAGILGGVVPGPLVHVGRYPPYNCTVEFSPDGSRLAIVRQVTAVRSNLVVDVYDVATGQMVSRRNGALTAASYSPDGKQLATVVPIGLAIVDPNTGEKIPRH
jgi:WD40 repeat protein